MYVVSILILFFNVFTYETTSLRVLNDLGNGTVENGYCWLQSAKVRLVDEQIRLSLSMIDLRNS